MKRLLLFLWRIFRRGLRVLVLSAVAVLAGYWLGKDSVAGSFSTGPITPNAMAADGPPFPGTAAADATPPPKELSLRHRLALLLQRHGTMSPRLTVELHSLSAEELRETLKIAETWPGGIRGYFYEQTLNALAWREPERALEELLSQKPSHARGYRLASVMNLWARRDPVAAYQKWESAIAGDKALEKYNFTSQALNGILPWLAAKDLPLAMFKARDLMKAFEENRSSATPHQALNEIAAKMQKDPRQREALIHELLKPENADPGILLNTLPVIFSQGDYSDPSTLQEAMVWLENPGTGDEARAAILSGVLDGRMKNEASEATAEWYLEQAAKAGLPSWAACREVVSKWAGRDLNSCGEWLNRQEPGPYLDHALANFSRAAAEEDMAAAFAWAARISRQDQRLNALSLAWGANRRLHSTAERREALNQSPITPADRQAFEAQLPPWE